MMDHRSPRWFSTGVPVRASRVPAGSARTACDCRVPLFLMAWASSQHHPLPCDLARAAAVAQRGAVGRDDQIGLGHRRAELVVPLPRPPRDGPSTGRPGANRAASFCQLLTSDIGQTSSVGATAPGRPARAGAAARASARSCRGPCRRPGCRPVPAGPGSAARTDPVPGTAAACPGTGGRRHRGEPLGRLPGDAGRRACRPRPPRPAAGPRSPPSTTCCSTSPAVISPVRRRPTALSAARSCRSSSSTHWPRTRTSGTLSRASSASSSAFTTPSPITRSMRKSTSSSSPKPEPAAARTRACATGWSA